MVDFSKDKLEEIRDVLRTLASTSRRAAKFYTVGLRLLSPNGGLIDGTVELTTADFSLQDQVAFTYKEASRIDKMAREFRMRLPSAREWGGIAFFITEEELKRFDLSRFNLSPNGFTWEGTPFRLEEGKAVYYWSSDSDCDSGMARALHIVKGKVDIEYRPVGQGMNLRFLLDS